MTARLLRLATIAVVLAVLILVAFGCTALKASALPAGGAAAGALVGSTVGPVGTVAGAAVGAVVGHGIGENAELRSGTLQGEGALERELARWKSRAAAAENAQTFLEKSKESLMSILEIAAIAAVGWFVWRNRANIKTLGVWKGLWHGIVGGAK